MALKLLHNVLLHTPIIRERCFLQNYLQNEKKNGRTVLDDAFNLQEDTADQESRSGEGEELDAVEQSPTVKVMGMEMTASCESGQKCSRPTTPIIPTPPRYYTYFIYLYTYFFLSLTVFILSSASLRGLLTYRYIVFSILVMSREKKRHQNPYI